MGPREAVAGTGGRAARLDIKELEELAEKFSKKVWRTPLFVHIAAVKLAM